MKKKILIVPISIVLMLVLCACIGSSHHKREIFDYVTNNEFSLPPNGKECVIYSGSGLPSAGVYFGYCYSADNKPVLPTEYKGAVNWEYSTVKDVFYQKGKGYYWGKPNNGTDWCYVEKIIDNWYYFEIHCG